MPQVDLDALVSVCGGSGSDRKIACETLADGDQQPGEPDLPPESFWLSKDAEFDWFDRNAFYERNDSTKGKSNSTNSIPNVNVYANSNSLSQRFSSGLKSKASIFGLPKTQKASFVDTYRRNCKPANIRLFPKRSDSAGKSAVTMTEPSSPKVSCMGRVRSKRGRRRPSTSEAATSTATATAAENVRTGRRRSTGNSSSFMSIFQSCCRAPAVKRDQPPSEAPPRKSLTVKAREIPVSVEPVAEPPGLGAMTRFASGRRSTSLIDEDRDQKPEAGISKAESSY